MRPQLLDFIFKDDRVFILEICQTENSNLMMNEEMNLKWSVITRRNVTGYPPYRTDSFDTKNQVMDYYKKIVVETPRVSLENKPPKPIPSLDEYVSWLKKENLFDPILNKI